MNEDQARDEVNHSWIDWALRRNGYEACTCTPEWPGLSKRGHQWGVSTLHATTCALASR